MNFLYVFGLDGNINNVNSSAGMYTGLKIKDNSSLISMGGNIGMEASFKENLTGSVEGTIGYNSEDGTNNYQNGLFANAGIKYKDGFEEYFYEERYDAPPNEGFRHKSGTEYSGELGLRFNAKGSTHTNISAFGNYNDFGDDKTTIVGGKYELSDGNKAMFAKVGIKYDENPNDTSFNQDEGSPFFGIGAKIALGF